MKNLLKKIPLFLLIFSTGTAIYAQDNQALIQAVLNEKASVYNLTSADIQNWEITDTHQDKKTGISYYYLTQKYSDLLLHNAISVVAIKDQKTFLTANGFIKELAQKTETNTATISAKDAILLGAQSLGLKISGDIIQGEKKNENLYIFNAAGLSKNDINVQLKLFQPDEETVRAVWDFAIYQLDQKHWWSIRVDAQTGELLDKVDWVLNCSFESNTSSPSEGISHPNHQQNIEGTPGNAPRDASGYNVFAIPVESPIHGSRSLEINPADPIASPYGWHDINGADGAEFTTTQGNNVYASEDWADADVLGYMPDGGTSLDFNFPLNPNQPAENNIDAAITNLFYMNNIMHDVWYQYGFDEASGNFQNNNYGNGGLDDDHVFAQAQDGGGMNNANMSTAPDGYNPVMQMYLWSPPAPNLLTVNSPSAISGGYYAAQAGFGTNVPSTPITSNIVLYNDNVSDPMDACQTAVNGASMNGKIVLVKRGGCDFTVKVQNAENEGAVAVIVVNNVGGNPFTMGGTDPGIGIPSIMISSADGADIIAQIQNNVTVNATIQSPPGSYDLDGDFDNGIMAHEYGHGISIRLTGGASTADCLDNREQMGEGWSDWFGLMLTMKPGDLGTDGRGMATYANGESSNGVGIRPQKYSTDFNINSATYAITNNTAAISRPHGIGFVWATMLWDLNWALIDKYGFDPDVYYGTGGNNVAMHLVINGLKLQNCQPGFVDGRDAILLADELLYNGENRCLIWQVFANRGLGYSANQGSSDSRTDQTEAFDLPPYIGTSSGSETISSCTAFTWAANNQTYTNSGTYTETLNNVYGCDSIVTLNLTISTPESSSTTKEVCNSYTWAENGQTYSATGIYTDTISGVNGCDSIVTLNLTISTPESSTTTEEACGSYTWPANGQTYAATGIYTDTLNGVNTCDSIVTLNLTINNSVSSVTTEEVCGSYTWSVNGQTYSATGVYTDTINGIGVCDSIVTLNLTISNIDTQVTIDSDDITLISTSGYSAYQWINCDKDFIVISGANNSSFTAPGNGNYAVIINEGTCSDTSACLIIDHLNLFEEEKNNIIIYPNPTDGMVNIDFMKPSEGSTIKVFDMIGKLVQEFKVEHQEQFKFSLKGGSGVYTIEVQTHSGIVQRTRLTKVN